MLNASLIIKLDSSFDFAGAEASGANIDMLGSAVHNRLNALYVGLESLVAATMRMGYLNTKGYTLAAYFTFRHDSTPPYQANRRDRKSASIIHSKISRFITHQLF